MLARGKTVKDVWEDNRSKINYLTRTYLDDVRVWFRYRSKITIRVKPNRLSEFKTNMDCKYCNTKEEESRDHLERCTGTEDLT